jgi:hypothetical protein
MRHRPSPLATRARAIAPPSVPGLRRLHQPHSDSRNTGALVYGPSLMASRTRPARPHVVCGCRVRLVAWALGLVLVAGAGLVVAPVGVRLAEAHKIGELAPTNYETRITAVTPVVPGLSVRVLGKDDELELSNATGRDVVVLGYAGEPYLRIGPRGVEENRRSPATYLNRTRFGTDPVPAEADPRAAPVWRRIRTGQTVSWHEHRAQRMELDDHPAVRADPLRLHVIKPKWTVQLRDGTRRITITGDLRWVPTPVPEPAPNPSPWGWLGAVAAGVFGLLAGVRGRLRRWRPRQWSAARPPVGRGSGGRALRNRPGPATAGFDDNSLQEVLGHDRVATDGYGNGWSDGR